MKKYLYTLWVLAFAVCSYAQDPAYPTAPGTLQDLTAAEYFIDTDPGLGAATPIPVAAATNIGNASVSINVNGLSNGVHRLYFRTRSTAGRWSITAVRDFLYDVSVAYIAPPAAAGNIIAAEYFIDTDPGIGAGTIIPIAPGTNLNNINATVNTASLSGGIHRLYVRTKNAEGRWSITNLKDFAVELNYNYPDAPAAPGNVVAAEYFIDTDPGAGGGTPITITAGTNLSAQTATINTAGVSQGIHRLYFRTKSAEGRWSLTNIRDFAISNEIGYPAAPPATGNIVAAEYFLDTDPGVGGGTPISINAGTDLSAQTVAINTTGKSNGTHFLFIRTKNQEGQWSITNFRKFDISDTARVPSWTLSPAGGHDFGAVTTNTPAVFNLKIHNTGNTPVTLGSVVSSSPAFVPSFTAGTVIDEGDSINLPVRFTPTAVAGYNGTIRIIASTPGFDSVTTTVMGRGFTPGTPPTLKFLTASPYSSVKGVNTTAGQTGSYTYKILYQSADNRPPQSGYPRLGIDRNGDQDFDDAGDQLFVMTKETPGADYAAGVVYSYTVTHNAYTNDLGYQFFATDDQGNVATTVNAGYFTGPVITFQLPDLKIFASDIAFSKSNPRVNESFTMTATVTNNSAFTATNVPVKFFKDTILLDAGVIPVVNPFSTASITHTFSFPTDGFYPIKVWIDSSNTLGDANMLNNYAIRPVNVGNVVLPGGIDISATASLQACPQTLLITGRADYRNTTLPTSVAGAEVTITLGGQTYTTTTDGAGNYSFVLQHPTCGSTLNYSVTVTDFTFTSKPSNGSINIVCENPNACVVQPQPGVNVTATLSSSPCGRKKGSTGGVDVVVTYRARNLANFWCSWDQILKDTVRIYYNGQLIETHGSADGTTSPGSTRTFHVNVTLSQTGPNVLEARQSYVYNEFFEIPSSFYKGMFFQMSGFGTVTMLAESDKPDLTINSFSQPTFTSFSFADANLKCGDAGSHKVQLWDSIPGSPKTLLREYTVNSLSGMSQTNLTYSNAGIARGSHFLTITTDTDNTVAEDDENNNIFSTRVEIPRPDLTIDSIKVNTTALTPGSTTTFTARVKNSGTVAGTFKVVFSVNGLPFGSKIVSAGVGEKGETIVTSDAFTVTTSARDCPTIVAAMVDIDGQVNEENENNNNFSINFGSDLTSYMLPSEPGSAGNPVVIRSNGNQEYHPVIRNIGNRDITNVTVKFTLNGASIGIDSVASIRSGEIFGVPVAFRHLFTAAGTYEVKVSVDTANAICEAFENNNIGSFFIRVVESNPDFEVLSPYISPSSLNPNPGQPITIVGTVKNVGLRTSHANILRFKVDGVQLGSDVPFNALLAGQDTTIAATALYSSTSTGVKVMSIEVDPDNTETEEQEGNNQATRSLIVGDAPDMARARVGAISLASGFAPGDSIEIAYDIRNNGSQQGTAWVRFLIYDEVGTLTGIDSVQFFLAAGGSTTIRKTMLFAVNKGKVVAQIAGCSPLEFDLLNNTDELEFGPVVHMKQSLTVSGDLDLKAALPEQLPGWTGGKLLLGNFDIVVNGHVTNFDSAHYIITDGTGKLKIINNDTDNLFPVGVTEDHPNFARITNTGTPDNFSVRILPYVLRGGTSGDTVRNENVKLTWLIEEEMAGGSNARIQLYWKASDQQSGFIPTTSRMAHYTTKWELGTAAAATLDSLGLYSVEQTGYTSFSPFTVTSGTGAALPLHLLSFNAMSQGSDALLTWLTTNEVNTSTFVIEHSTDGQRFTDIGKLSANNTPGDHRYQFVDSSLMEGDNYYRLRMVDVDGSYTRSKIKIVSYRSSQVLQVFPNPAQRFVNVQGMTAGGLMQLFSLDGRMLQQRIVGSGTLTLDISTLAAGTYFINYSYQGKARQQKFIKE